MQRLQHQADRDQRQRGTIQGHFRPRTGQLAVGEEERRLVGRSRPGRAPGLHHLPGWTARTRPQCPEVLPGHHRDPAGRLRHLALIPTATSHLSRPLPRRRQTLRGLTGTTQHQGSLSTPVVHTRGKRLIQSFIND
ncbi:MAG: hypothetical protein US42_C0001G0023 [Candidatus Magasanikbacteria bacterium GW2011_GWC2_37_14]|uniref:Uncharacterized protein n=1 Tax=Candidatus Magasanikbacteria bacterium GW2011_GWC2_37_14 TaxID=1619046 RepID=A0A0G0GDX4_9BACT|nr:MAG: hypothetical protein US42_C0001G0023 [Candidatus Magasanikbacteria bacterium GW2011_GWC2_37_14]